MSEFRNSASRELAGLKKRVSDLEAREARLQQEYEDLKQDYEQRRLQQGPQQEHDTERRLLHICHTASTLDALMRELVVFFQDVTRCEAVGVRLRREEDFPYYETQGFPAAFVRAENSLCSRDIQGEMLLESTGSPVLECMCGNIVSGRFDPARPFFTQGGSFWTNSTSHLLANTSEVDRRARTRNRCHGEGYESVALIPIRVQKTTFGLIQFNDHRRDRFTEVFIKQLEDLVSYVAIALAKVLTDEKLRTSEETYRLLFENAQEAIVVLQDGLLEMVNPAGGRLMGFPEKELQGVSFAEFIHPDDRAMVTLRHTKRLQGEDVPSTYCFRGLTRQGTVRWLEQNGSLIDWKGKPASLNFLTDITERVQMEEALRKSEANLLRALKVARLGPWEYDVADDRFLFNDQFYALYHTTADQEGGYYMSSADYTRKFLHPEDRAMVDHETRKATESATGSDYYTRTDHRIICRDGREKHIAVHIRVAKDGQGRTVKTYGVNQDITDYRLAEQNYLTLFREMLDGFALHEIICDADGIPVDYRFLAVNPAFERMTGLQSADIIGRTVREVLPGTENHWIETYGRVALTGEPAFFESDSAALNKFFEVRVYRPAPNQFACIFADTTERKHSEEERKKLHAQLNQAQKMEAIGTLAGGIAHDFNNILGAILGYAEMAREDCAAGSVTAGDLDQVVLAGHRAKDLVKQILAFSRQVETEWIPLQTAIMAKEAIRLLRSSLPTTIVIQQDIDPDCKLIFADPIQIHQILMNLCTNAYHAMEETGGVLTISLQNKVFSRPESDSHPSVPSGDFVQLSVGDTGQGISPEIRGRIFDPYFTTKEVGKGTGMGLAIVHGIVQRYGGFIDCRSVIGEGTVFEVNLPVMAEESLPEAMTDTIIPAGRESILFVDDEEVLAEMARSMLSRLGYSVTVRTTSLETLATFENRPDAFDLVITDQTMPGMTGLDLARRMLQIRPDLPIILCTGYSSQVSEEKAKAAGIRGFALKPLAKADLAALIRKVLDQGNRAGEEPKGR